MPLNIFFQEVNENSLKRLSAYLENLQKPGFKSLKPTQLMFYVRETDQNSSDDQEHFSTSGTFLISRVSHEGLVWYVQSV